MNYINFYKKLNNILFVLFYLISFSFAYAQENETEDFNNSLINPTVPSMNNGVPYIPLPSPDNSINGHIVDNGNNLEINGSKVPIVGSKDLDQTKFYKPLSKFQEDEIKKFCLNIREPIKENYFAIQTQKLEKLKKDIDDRIITLNNKKNEYQTWLNKRNEFLKKAKAALVNIISKMDPEEAALKLDKMDDLSAASLLLTLKPRISGAIMNNLSADKAAYLSQIIIDAQRIPKKLKTISQKQDSSNIPKPVD